MSRFRHAQRADVPQIVAMLADDVLGQGREGANLAPYYAAFDQIAQEPGNHIFVADLAGAIVATYQLTFISGLSLMAARRAQIESVRVAAPYRGKGWGGFILEDAHERAGRAGCAVVQLTSNKTRGDALRFYESHGYVPSHVGFKRALD